MPSLDITISRARLAGFVVAATLAASPAAAAIPAAERNALVALFNSTNGPGWVDKYWWLGAPGTECTWYGVVCNAGQTTVLEINLRDDLLHGPLPAQLGSLTGLRRLDLSRNRLTGPIPAELGSLPALEVLDLSSIGQPPYSSFSELSGAIPAALGNLANLRELRLAWNWLSGSIPPQLGRLSRLTYLDLSGNTLSGPIPPELGSLPVLKTLVLQYNKLSGPIPPQLGNLAGLENLHLRWNQLSGAVPAEIGGLSSLQYLSLESNLLVGSIPWQLVNLSSLQFGYLRWNALHAEDPALVSFLDGRTWWDAQTVAPANVTAVLTGPTTVTLAWTPIAYSGGWQGGGYRVFTATSPAGPYEIAAITADKLASGAVIAGLAPGVPHYFVVDTFTRPHNDNPNTVYSERSATVQAERPRVLTLTTVGPGKVTSNPGGIDCGGSCSAGYAVSTTVTLTASAASGQLFAGWSGDCAGLQTSLSLTMDGDKACTATFGTVVVSTRSKTVAAGPFTAGAPVHYTITLANGGTSAQPDNAGPELVDVLPAELESISASASSGAIAVAGSTVSWDGGIPAGGSVTIGIDAAVRAGVALGTVVSNQATIRYDADADGSNESTAPTDDPGPGGPADPTRFGISPPMRFHTLTPCRLIDTRSPVATYGGPALAGGRARVFPLRGQCGIPATALALS